MFRRKIDIALAALLMLTMFGMGGLTVAQHGRELAYAVVKGYTNYIKQDGQPLASVKARVSALTTTINHTLPAVDELERSNILFQMALGKQIVSVGGETMVKLKTGQLYDLLPNTDMKDDDAKMAKLKDNLSVMGIPMFYVYPHSYIYDAGIVPDGVKDYNIEDADELVSGLRAADIPVVDSRDAYKAAGLTIGQAIYRTDQHWATPELFATFQKTCEQLNQMGFSIDPSLYASESFTSETYPKMHMGQVGERLGPKYIEPDDFTILQPVYDTLLHKKVVNGSATSEQDGSFHDLLNWKLVDAAKKDGVGNLYWVYGNQDAETWYVNDKISTGRILIAKDSYGTPFVDYLALTAHEVLAVDMRKSSRSIEDYAREYKPDLVIVAHSQAMLREANYVFVE